MRLKKSRAETNSPLSQIPHACHTEQDVLKTEVRKKYTFQELLFSVQKSSSDKSRRTMRKRSDATFCETRRPGAQATKMAPGSLKMAPRSSMIPSTRGRPKVSQWPPKTTMVPLRCGDIVPWCHGGMMLGCHGEAMLPFWHDDK